MATELEETLKNRSTLAAPLIVFIVVVLQLLSISIEHLKKKGLRNAEQIQLRQEIKQLLKEASSLSAPSTFAQAAKLRRMAAAKEKELIKCQEEHNKENKWPYDTNSLALAFLKAFMYLGLTWSFWGVPIAAISPQLLQPFGRILSWRAGDPATGHVMVGIIPWLVLTTRVCKFICQRLSK